jgi:chain length determinant protein tyrosine kinase EpsG
MKTSTNLNLKSVEPNVHVMTAADQSLGTLLIESGKLSRADADRVMELQRREGWRFGEAALRLGLIDETDLACALHAQYDVPMLLPENGQFSPELVAAYDPYHRRTEELRALRTQLLIRWYQRPSVDNHMLAVVSPGSGDGRSYVAANLAVLFAQLGERTLLIDADLRTPRQHKIFHVPDRVGLSSVLAGRARADAAVAIPGLSNLMLLPAGAPPPNPLELLSRPVLPALLKEYANDFDVILLDTPPAQRYSDAQTIGYRAGNAMVLARKDHTRAADAARVVRDLDDGGTRVVGTVLNSH